MDPWRLRAEKSDMIHQVILHVFIMVHVYLSFHSWWWHGWPSSWYLLFNFIQIIYIDIYIYSSHDPHVDFNFPLPKMTWVACSWVWWLWPDGEISWNQLMRQRTKAGSHCCTSSCRNIGTSIGLRKRDTHCSGDMAGNNGIHRNSLYVLVLCLWNQKTEAASTMSFFSRNAQQFHAISLCRSETWLCKSLFLLGWILGISDEAEGLLSRLDAVWKAHLIMCGHASCSVPTYGSVFLNWARLHFHSESSVPRLTPNLFEKLTLQFRIKYSISV